MKILIDLTSIAYNITGIERYAMCISQKMIEYDDFNEYVLLFKDAIHEDFLKLSQKNNVDCHILHGSNRLIFHQIVVLKELLKARADKYIFFAFPSPLLFFKKGIINTIHDMGCWDMPKAMKKSSCIYFKVSYLMASLTSECIITVSEFSKSRINKLLHYKNDKIFVVPSAISEKLQVNECKGDEILKKFSLPSKYILTLSTLEPRKNLQFLLNTYMDIVDQVDYDLVLVGRKGWKIEELLKQSEIVRNRVHLTGFVEDEDVAIIYKNALCFIFPTLYEGFGLPPVEALSFGTPVISSDAASMHEVLGEQAVFFESNNKTQLSDLLINLRKNLPSMKSELSNYQRENYNFSISAKKMLTIISNLR